MLRPSPTLFRAVFAEVYHEDFVFDNQTNVHDAKMAIKKAGIVSRKMRNVFPSVEIPMGPFTTLVASKCFSESVKYTEVSMVLI